MFSINDETVKTADSVDVGQQEQYVRNYSTLLRAFSLLLPKVYALADKTEEPSFDITDLEEFSKARTADNNFRLVAAAVGQPNRLCSYDADSILVRLLPVDGTSRR